MGRRQAYVSDGSWKKRWDGSLKISRAYWPKAVAKVWLDLGCLMENDKGTGH